MIIIYHSLISILLSFISLKFNWIARHLCLMCTSKGHSLAGGRRSQPTSVHKKVVLVVAVAGCEELNAAGVVRVLVKHQVARICTPCEHCGTQLTANISRLCHFYSCSIMVTVIRVDLWQSGFLLVFNFDIFIWNIGNKSTSRTIRRKSLIFEIAFSTCRICVALTEKVAHLLLLFYC